MNKCRLARAVAEKICDQLDIDSLAQYFIEQQTNYLVDDRSLEEIIELANIYGVDIYEI